MQKTLVKYRTNQDDAHRTDKWNWEYVVIPTIWLSDLLQWLSDIEAEVDGTTDNVEYDVRLPINWPGLSDCQYSIKVSDAIHCVL